jgi:hypothetical protein
MAASTAVEVSAVAAASTAEVEADSVVEAVDSAEEEAAVAAAA